MGCFIKGGQLTCDINTGFLDSNLYSISSILNEEKYLYFELLCVWTGGISFLNDIHEKTRASLRTELLILSAT